MNWQNWKFVIGFNAREGLDDASCPLRGRGRERGILYRASLTEMVVPYGDPRPTQARKNAFDVGEYGMGMCANSLQLGCDCLGDITYLDANLCDSRGRALTIPNAICIHEEDYGILWKHTDRRLPGQSGSAPVPPVGGVFHLYRGELRIRLLLVLLPGRQYRVPVKADRHSFAGRRASWRKAAARRDGCAAALRA